MEPRDWHSLLRVMRLEMASLSTPDRQWLQQRLASISALQNALDALFLQAGGQDACRGCDGACCGCGRHHLTLTNLFGYLLDGADPPVPDFSQPCPFLGATGCRLPVPRRPYNCITFFCETLEDRLTGEERLRLRELDGRLRREYERIATRFPLASLRGLWIALERHGGRFLLRSGSEPC